MPSYNCETNIPRRCKLFRACTHKRALASCALYPVAFFVAELAAGAAWAAAARAKQDRIEQALSPALSLLLPLCATTHEKVFDACLRCVTLVGTAAEHPVRRACSSYVLNVQHPANGHTPEGRAATCVLMHQPCDRDFSGRRGGAAKIVKPSCFSSRLTCGRADSARMCKARALEMHLRQAGKSQHEGKVVASVPSDSSGSRPSRRGNQSRVRMQKFSVQRKLNIGASGGTLEVA